MTVKQKRVEAPDPDRSAPQMRKSDRLPASAVRNRDSEGNRPSTTDQTNLPAVATRSRAASAELMPTKKLRRIVCLLARERAKQVTAMIALLSQESGIEVRVECVTDLESLNRRRRGYTDTLIVIDATLLARASHGVDEFAQIQPGSVRTMILLDDWPDMTILTRFVLHGISGCILLSSPASFYRRAISAISCGELWFPRQTMSDAIGRLLEPGGQSPELETGPPHSTEFSRFQRLTEREQAIVVLLRAGLTNKEIGRRLGISNETVKKHLGRVFRRLGVRNRTQLALETDSPPPR